MPALKYLDPVSGTYKTIPGIMGPTGPGGPTGPAGLTDPSGAASGVWGSDWLAKAGSDEFAGRSIYVDSTGKFRARPQELSASQGSAMFDGNSAPGAWPLGSLILQVTAPTASTWPGAVSGTVLTVRRPNEGDSTAAVHQWFYRTSNTLAGQSIMYRSASGNPTSWSPWRETLPDDTGWQALAFSGDWGNYGGAYQVGQYRRIGDRVFLRGLIKAGAAKTTTSAMFTLPADCRPPATALAHVQATVTQVTGAASTGTAHTHSAAYSIGIRVDMLTSGVFQVPFTSILQLGAGGYIALDSIPSFSVTA